MELHEETEESEREKRQAKSIDELWKSFQNAQLQKPITLKVYCFEDTKYDLDLANRRSSMINIIHGIIFKIYPHLQQHLHSSALLFYFWQTFSSFKESKMRILFAEIENNSFIKLFTMPLHSSKQLNQVIEAP